MTTHTKIRVAIVTRKALKDIGRKGESYDDVLRRLIKYWVLEEVYEGAARILYLLYPEEEVRE